MISEITPEKNGLHVIFIDDHALNPSLSICILNNFLTPTMSAAISTETCPCLTLHAPGINPFPLSFSSDYRQNIVKMLEEPDSDASLYVEITSPPPPFPILPTSEQLTVTG